MVSEQVFTLPSGFSLLVAVSPSRGTSLHMFPPCILPFRHSSLRHFSFPVAHSHGSNLIRLTAAKLPSDLSAATSVLTVKLTSDLPAAASPGGEAPVRSPGDETPVRSPGNNLSSGGETPIR